MRRLVEAGLAEATRNIIEKREDLETLALWRIIIDLETVRWRREDGRFEKVNAQIKKEI
jgi:hypothetical protein